MFGSDRNAIALLVPTERRMREHSKYMAIRSWRINLSEITVQIVSHPGSKIPESANVGSGIFVFKTGKIRS